MRVLGAQIFVSKSGPLKEMVDSGTGVGKIKDEPGMPCGAGKRRRTQSLR